MQSLTLRRNIKKIFKYTPKIKNRPTLKSSFYQVLDRRGEKDGKGKRRWKGKKKGMEEKEKNIHNWE